MINKRVIEKLKKEKDVEFISEITYNKKTYVKTLKILRKRNGIHIL